MMADVRYQRVGEWLETEAEGPARSEVISSSEWRARLVAVAPLRFQGKAPAFSAKPHFRLEGTWKGRKTCQS